MKNQRKKGKALLKIPDFLYVLNFASNEKLTKSERGSETASRLF